MSTTENPQYASITPATGEGDATGWLAPIAVLAIGTFVMGTDSFVLAGILPQIAEGLAVSPAAAGQVVTAFALAYGVAAPFLAAFAAGIPRKALLMAALALFAAANLGSALAPDLPVLLASRVIAGLGAALFTPTAYAAAASLAGPARQGRALAIVLGGLTVGTVFGVPVGTALGQHLGWRIAMAFIVLIAVGAILALALIMRRLPLPEKISLGRRLAVLARPQVLGIVGITLLGTAGGILVYTFIAEILLGTSGIAGTGLALTLLIWGIGGTVGAFGSGWATDRFGARPTATAALLVLAATLLGLGFARMPAATSLVMAIYGMAGWAITTPNSHRLARIEPKLANVAISLNSSGSYLGQASGAALGGILIAHSVGPTGLCLAGAALTVMALGLNAIGGTDRLRRGR